MLRAPDLAEEKHRLDAPRRLPVLNTPTEERFERIAALAANKLKLAQIHQSGNLALANPRLGQGSFDGIVLAIYEHDPVMDTLQAICSAALRYRVDVPVTTLVRPGETRPDQQVSELDVMRVPPVLFRILEVLDGMRAMWPRRQLI